MDTSGNLYGTTLDGGSSLLNGTVFKIDTSNHETVLHNFTGGSDGTNPRAVLIMDTMGNLYGTTWYGGSDDCGIGCGTVFKIDTSNHETVLYSFTDGNDGADILSGLIMDTTGNLYGTAALGGSNFSGTVFILTKSGSGYTENVLYSFSYTGISDGGGPEAGLVMDTMGNLYGTTSSGGSTGCGGYGCGTVFKIDSSNHETVVHAFTGGSDGVRPLGGLIMDAAGNLYGTTAAGGTGNCSDLGLDGCGTVFKIDTSNHETVLYSFAGGNDGENPFAGLIMDAAGNLYGTTAAGGTGNCSALGVDGCGTLFKIDTSNHETVLYSFTDGNDGAFPYAGLIMDAAGNLYGTTAYGGSSTSSECAGFGCGTVFKLALPHGVPSSGTTCDGQYNGTFHGNITVSAGQSCQFFGGGIIGNVAENGGNLFLSATSVSGNVGINAGTFTITSGTLITGNLSADNLPRGAVLNQICGSGVRGNVQLDDSAAPIDLGAYPAGACGGNAVMGNVQVQNNTAAVEVGFNTVTSHLQCSGNTSVTGGGNTASSKQGQCAGF